MITLDLDRLRLRPGQAVLDLGCGQGRHVHALHDRAGLRVLGMDLDREAARQTRGGCLTYFSGEGEGSNWLVATGSCLSLPFATSSLDAVICSEVLEHLQDYSRALREIKRVLRPGGSLALSVPRRGPERVCWWLSRDYRNQPGGHVRIFSSRSLKREIREMGFFYRGGHFAHGLHTPYWWLKCLRWEKRESWPPVRLYHRLLVWDILSAPRLTRFLDSLLTPLMGKSVVMYFQRI